MTVSETEIPSGVVTGLAEIISSVAGTPVGDVTPQASFADLEVDSLSMIEITLAIEERFGVHVSDEDAEHLSTVQDAVDYIVAAASAG
jgi:acyl carrier protein